MAFICEVCFKRTRPKGFFWPMSYGPCEVCKKTRQCADA